MNNRKSIRVLFVLLLNFVITINTLYAQTLYGFVKELNSKNKPVKNVMVKGNCANQVETTDKGEFTLQFQLGKPGNTVLIFADKEGWVVTDKTKLTPNLPEDPYHNPHVVIVCPKEKWKKLLDESLEVCEKGMRASYEKRVAELYSEISGLNKENKSYQTVVDSLNKKIDLLIQQFNEQQDNALKFAEEHSKQNLDEITDLEKKAYQLFSEGKIEESLALRESMKSIENIEKRNVEIKSLQQTIGNNIAANEIDRRNLKQLAKEAQLLFKWDKAETALEYLARDTTDYDAMYEYADFLKLQNEFHKSQLVFDNLLNLLKCIDQTNNTEAIFRYANTLNNYGNMLRYQQLYSKAADVYLSSYEQFKRIDAKNSTDLNILAKYAWLLSDMGNNYRYMRRFSEANPLHKECLKIRKFLMEKDQVQYQAEYAKILHNFGSNLREQNQMDSVMSYYMQSLSIWENLNNKVEQAHVISSMAKYYGMLEQYDKANFYYDNAINLRIELSKENPPANEPKLAQTYSWAGTNNYYNKNFELAESDFIKSNVILAKYIDIETKAYLSYLTDNLNYLWLIKLQHKKLDNIESDFDQTIDLCKKYFLAITDLDNITKRKVLTTLTSAYLLKGKLPEAEKILIDANKLGADLKINLLTATIDLINGNTQNALQSLQETMIKSKQDKKISILKNDCLLTINYLVSKKMIAKTDDKFYEFLDMLNN
jgi:hypothetical protein